MLTRKSLAGVFALALASQIAATASATDVSTGATAELPGVKLWFTDSGGNFRDSGIRILFDIHTLMINEAFLQGKPTHYRRCALPVTPRRSKSAAAVLLEASRRLLQC